MCLNTLRKCHVALPRVNNFEPLRRFNNIEGSSLVLVASSVGAKLPHSASDTTSITGVCTLLLYILLQSRSRDCCLETYQLNRQMHRKFSAEVPRIGMSSVSARQVDCYRRGDSYQMLTVASVGRLIDGDVRRDKHASGPLRNAKPGERPCKQSSRNTSLTTDGQMSTPPIFRPSADGAWVIPPRSLAELQPC
jgi:hypothetical protein